MQDFFAALPTLSFIEAIRFSRWGYAFLNASHILSFALLFGAVTALNLRLIGWWPEIYREQFVKALSPLAAFGLIGATLTGCLLFATRATHYVGLEIFILKILLVSLGTLSALFAHARYGTNLYKASNGQARFHGILSLLIWITALINGRLIAFMD